jgi:L-lactate dehydrogenase complex protein LldG
MEKRAGEKGTVNRVMRRPSENRASENAANANPASANPSRERILARIREGLRIGVKERPPFDRDCVIFAPVLDRIERFQTECAANLIECCFTRESDESALKIAEALSSLPAGEVFVQDAPQLRRLIEDASYRNHVHSSERLMRWSSEGAPRKQSQATITLAEALIAQTGSVLVSSNCGGRGASVVAPCHIVFATADQIVDDLAAVLKEASERQILEHNSFVCVITGSSRTADIEKILIQGAHGPQRVVVIVQKN